MKITKIRDLFLTNRLKTSKRKNDYAPPPIVCKNVKLPSFMSRFQIYKLSPKRLINSLTYRISKIAYNINSIKKPKFYSFGEENPDKIFYIMREPFWPDAKNIGHASVIIFALPYYAFADANGYIPIVEESKTIRSKSDIFYTQYCLPPHSPENYLKSKNILYSRESDVKNFSMDFYYTNPANTARFKYFQNIFKKYIKFNQPVLNYMENDFNSIIGNKRVLGCLCRGTDYLKKENAIIIQPDVNIVIDKTEEIMKTKNCPFIYLATESEEIYQLFKKQFGDNLLTNSQLRFGKKDLQNIRFISQVKERRQNDRYLTGLEYLSSLNILSKCKCFIAGQTTGSQLAYMMSEGFEYSFIYYGLGYLH
jgi:hypothetical protein